MDRVKERRRVRLAGAGGAVLLGGAGALLGPVWAVAGLVTGLFAALVIYGVVQTFRTPDPAGLLEAGRHREALRAVDEMTPGARRMARMWPGQFREYQAHLLVDKSLALLAAFRVGEAVAAAEQGVASYRSLAAARPARPMPGLAMALNNLCYPLRAAGRHDEALAAAAEAVQIRRALATAHPRKYRYELACTLGTEAEMLAGTGQLAVALTRTSEAAHICQDRPARRHDTAHAAEVLFLHGQLLCQAGRYREAVRPLAQAWHLAAEHQHDKFDKQVLQTAYRADPAGFLSTWRTETGSPPPDPVIQDDNGSPGS